MDKPTRDGFGKGLVKAGRNKNVVALTADLAESTRVHWFKQKYPKRFFEIGVAEQNLVTVASGMAAMGKIPFTTSYATFQPGRCLEQIRTTIAYNNQPVKVVGCHAGISVGPDGATHQALEDIAWMRTMPNMNVFVPADAIEAEKITLASVKLGPCYIRLGREKTPVFTEKTTPFKVGKASVLREGNDVTVIGCGPLVHAALQAAHNVRDKLSVRVLNMATIKPLDKRAIIKAARDTGAIVTIEEHSVLGGLGGAVAEVVAEQEPVHVTRLGVLDRFGESGPPLKLYAKFGLTSHDVEKAILKAGMRTNICVSDEVRDTLGKVEKGKAFHFTTGQIARSIPEMATMLKTMPHEKFHEHVNEQKNDICHWVRETFNDDVLAHLLSIHKTKEEMTEILNMRMAYLEKKAGW